MPVSILLEVKGAFFSLTGLFPGPHPTGSLV